MTAPTGWASVRQQLIDQSRTDDPDSVIGDRRPVSGLLSTSPLRDVEVRASAVSLVTLPPSGRRSLRVQRSALMPSTSFGVSAGRFASFRVVSRSQIRRFPSSQPLFGPGSIPGSSTEKKLVKAKSLGQHSFSSTRHQHQSSKLTSWRRFGLVRVKTAALKSPICATASSLPDASRPRWRGVSGSPFGTSALTLWF